MTVLNWFHISPQVVFMRISISSLSFWEAARSLCERRMLSSVNLDHDSGSESLEERKKSVSSHSLGEPGQKICPQTTFFVWRSTSCTPVYLDNKSFSHFLIHLQL